jgi:hypothetical protein
MSATQDRLIRLADGEFDDARYARAKCMDRALISPTLRETHEALRQWIPTEPMPLDPLIEAERARTVDAVKLAEARRQIREGREAGQRIAAREAEIKRKADPAGETLFDREADTGWSAAPVGVVVGVMGASVLACLSLVAAGAFLGRWAVLAGVWQ